MGDVLVMADAETPLNELFGEHRERLRRMVRLRMDQRVQGRIDASDVIQEAFVEAAQRIDEYRQQKDVSPFVWLRFLTAQKLVQLQRRHLGVQGRAVQREIRPGGGVPNATSAVLAAQLVGNLTSPSRAFAKEEQRMQVQEALDSLDVIDREVIALRHFEQLSNAEVAEVLELAPDTAYKRYIRALRRLKQTLNFDAESNDGN